MSILNTSSSVSLDGDSSEYSALCVPQIIESNKIQGGYYDQPPQLYEKLLVQRSVVECEHEIVYHPQERKDTCAVAMFRMVLDTLLDEAPTEKELCNLLGMTRGGTFPSDIATLANQRFGLEVRHYSFAPLAEVKRLLRDGYLVGISFRHPEDAIPHMGLVKAVGRFAIAIVDPWPDNGENSALRLQELEWLSENSRITHGKAGEVLAFRL